MKIIKKPRAPMMPAGPCAPTCWPESTTPPCCVPSFGRRARCLKWCSASVIAGEPELNKESSPPPPRSHPEPLRIGLSARLMHTPPKELGFHGKTLQYLE